VDTQTYYLPNEVADDRGKTEAVRLLYEDARKNETQKFSTVDNYNVITSNDRGQGVPRAPRQINVLIPEGFRDALSLDTKTAARICVNFLLDLDNSCSFPYQANIKALITKIPGFLFMSYRQIAFAGTILTSEIDFKSILNDIIKAD
jgi:hypothetical protein